MGAACFSKYLEEIALPSAEDSSSWNNRFICQGSKSGSYLKRAIENARGRSEKGDRNSNLIWKEQNVISRRAPLAHENIFVFSGCSTPFQPASSQGGVRGQTGGILVSKGTEHLSLSVWQTLRRKLKRSVKKTTLLFPTKQKIEEKFLTEVKISPHMLEDGLGLWQELRLSGEGDSTQSFQSGSSNLGWKLSFGF